MPIIKPITELRNTTEISELCHSKKEPLFITKNGYGDLVVMSIEVYEELMEMLAIDQGIFQAERQFAKDSKLLDARESLELLRRKYFGKV